MDLQIRLIDNVRELETIKALWDELYDSIPPPHGHPFNCFSWLFPYAKLLQRRGALLQVFCVYDGDKVVGIAPLQIPRRKLLGFNTVQFIGHQFSDYCDFICRREHEAVVAETLLGHWQSVFGNGTIFDFNQFHESSATPSVLQAGVENLGGQVREIPWWKAFALNLTVCGGTDLLNKILSKKHCRQRTREMKRLGRVEFVCVATQDGIQSHLERLFYYHRLRWHQRKTWVHSMDEAVKNAYMLCICQMALEKRAAIVALTVDDLPYAYAVALKKDKFLYYMMPVHNVFSGYSPGTSLLYYILRYVRDDGYGELDFTVGEEHYKTRFSNIVRQNRRVFFTFSSSRVFSEALRLIERLRSTAPLVDNIRSLRSICHQAVYKLRDYLSQMTGRLMRLDYRGIKLCIGSILSNRSSFIYKLDLAKACHVNEPENNIRVKEISVIEAVKFVCRYHGFDSPAIWGELLRRELEGAECYGAFICNQLIHTSWASDHKDIVVIETGEALQLQDRECCVFDSRTLPEYRGRGVYVRTLRHIAQVKLTSGYDTLHICAHPSRVSLIRDIEGYALKRAGCRLY